MPFALRRREPPSKSRSVERQGWWPSVELVLVPILFAVVEARIRIKTREDVEAVTVALTSMVHQTDVLGEVTLVAARPRGAERRSDGA